MTNHDYAYSRIAEIESAVDYYRVPFISGRYPYTYAYDYVRSHAEYFDMSPSLSREEVSRALRDATLGKPQGDSDEEDWFRHWICTPLADAYLREHHIVRSSEEPEAGK